MLSAGAGNLDSFNREQQAQIIEHYFVRRFFSNPPLDFAAWEPYAQKVRA